MTHIVGIAGSLRQGSYNKALLRAIVEVAPAGTTIETGSIAGIPLYDADREAAEGPPPVVAALRARLAVADGLLLVTPEYNQGIPAPLKNAVDWLSRPGPGLPDVFRDRPVAVLGATPGLGGTRMAQAAWLPVLRALGARTWSGGQLYVAGAGQAFDADGHLVDAKVRALLTTFVAGFAEFAGRG